VCVCACEEKQGEAFVYFLLRQGWNDFGAAGTTELGKDLAGLMQLQRLALVCSNVC